MNEKPVVKARSQRKALQESDLGFAWGRWNTFLLALGVAVLAVGYVSLSKGSTTLAPLLLVSGYVVLIPASLLIRSRNTGE